MASEVSHGSSRGPRYKGATRNLTTHFLRLRSRFEAERKRRHSAFSVDDNKPLIDNGTGLMVDSTDAGAGAGAGAGWDSARRAVPPTYVDVVSRCHTHMEQIEDKMKQLQYLHKQRMRVGFDDAAEGEHEQNIDILTRSISQHFSMAGQAVKSIPSTVRVDGADGNVRKNLQRSLASKLHAQSVEFRRMQKTYIQQVSKRGGGDLLGGDSNVDPTDVDLGFTEAQQAAVAQMEFEVDANHQEIVRIAKSVEDLAAIFKDLATLVIDQGTVLDRIDYNMDCVVEKTKAGVKQLTKADDYSKKSTRAIKCIGVLICLIVVMVVILVLKWKK